jgi:hypothetical protein
MAMKRHLLSSIDPMINNPKKKYTIIGRKNALGILMPETSLKQILANCGDFEEEEMMLQSVCLLTKHQNITQI